MVDDQRHVVLGGFGLIVGFDFPLFSVVSDESLRPVDVGAGDDVFYFLHADAIAGELLRVQLDAYGRLRSTADENVADAFKLHQFLGDDGIGGVVHLSARQRFRRHG